MTELREISLEQWLDVLFGRTNNPSAEEEIIAAAEMGKLRVIDNAGRRLKPLRLDDDHWAFEEPAQ